MPTTLTPALKEVAPPLTFDERLALSPHAMDSRLNTAGLTFDVNTAAIELPEILVGPLPAASTATPTTVDEVFAEAVRLIRTHGWIRRYAGSPQTGYCLIGAVRAAAGGNRRLEDAAEAGLLDRIRRQFPDALSVGQWNDNQSGPGPVLRMLG